MFLISYSVFLIFFFFLISNIEQEIRNVNGYFDVPYFLFGVSYFFLFFKYRISNKK